MGLIIFIVLTLLITLFLYADKAPKHNKSKIAVLKEELRICLLYQDYENASIIEKKIKHYEIQEEITKTVGPSSPLGTAD